MNSTLLLEHYARIADAPDAIVRLRALVVALATRGRITGYEGPWLHATLGDLGRWGSGGTPSKSHPEYYGGEIPWVVIGDLNDGIVDSSQSTITHLGLENSAAKIIEPGAVLIAMYGSIGKLGINSMPCATNQAIAYCHTFERLISRDFFFWLLRSLRGKLLARGQGVAQQNISQKILKAWPVELPELAEQQRIVARVEELMALCDQLENARAEREAGRDRLTAATLTRLNAPDPKTFPADARFALDNLAPLTTRPDQIKRLRQTILNLAVHGRLTKQDPADEPASKLIERISKNNDCKVLKQRSKRKNYLDLTNEEVAFTLPRGWQWSQLGSVYDVRDGTHTTPKYVPSGYPLITSKNLRTGYLAFDDVKYISQADHCEIAQRSKVDRGDVLFAMIGSIGNPVVVDVDTEFSIKNVALFKSRDRALAAPEFLRIFLLHSAEMMRKKAAGGLQPFVSLGFLRAFPIPVPPLAEQVRIIIEVNKLMSICDELEASLINSEHKRSTLLETVLRNAIEPA